MHSVELERKEKNRRDQGSSHSKLLPPPCAPPRIYNSAQNRTLTTPPASDMRGPPPAPQMAGLALTPGIVRPPMPVRRGLSPEELSRSRLAPVPTTNYSTSAPIPAQWQQQAQPPREQKYAHQPNHHINHVQYTTDTYSPPNAAIKREKCPTCGGSGFAPTHNQQTYYTQPPQEQYYMPQPQVQYQALQPQAQYNVPQHQQENQNTGYKAESYMPANVDLKKRECPRCGAIGPDINEMQDRSRIISYVPRRIYAKKFICKKCMQVF